MKKCSALILLACAFALLTAERVAAGPITWDFIATSCSGSVIFGGSDCDPHQSYPLVLATLTLSGPDSVGSAMLPPPSLIGDPFDFEIPGRTSVSTDHPLGTGAGIFGVVVDYNISWSEIAGALISVGISIDTEVDTIRNLGLTGGLVSSDFQIAGCTFLSGTCQISGFWVNASLVTAPEPGSLALLASAFGVFGLIRRRRNATCFRQPALSGSAVSEKAAPPNNVLAVRQGQVGDISTAGPNRIGGR